jgi:hypothetical protein
MKPLIRIFGISSIVALGGCAHRAADGSVPVNGDVPSKRRGVILPSDPAGPAGTRTTTGTEGGRIDSSMGKGISGGGTSP